jgi:CBS domain containing-hemolysin-like protein
VTTEWLLLGLVVVLIGANAVFVAAEFSFVTADRSVVEREAEAGTAGAANLLAALRGLSTQLSGAQLGITVTSLVVGFVAEPSLAALLRGPLGLTGLSEEATTGTAFGVAFVLATGSQMVFGELVPKNWAIAEPLRVGRRVAGFQRGFTLASRPLISVLNGMANQIIRAMGIEPAEELASARSPGELASLARRSAERGTMEAGTAELISRSIEFGDRRADDVMTPRPRVRFLDVAQPVSEVLSLATDSGHARFPALGEGVDDVVGVVHFKHALAVSPPEREEVRIGAILRDLPAVPATMELDPLLRVLREAGPQMAVVVDEYGGTDGIVTLEDLVEEIVGEIEDEQDQPAGRVRELPDGGWSLSGLLRPDEVEQITRLRLPDAEQSDTIGGLLTEHLGRLPDLGDTVYLEAADLDDPDEDGVPAHIGVTLTVRRLDGRRADKLRLDRTAEERAQHGGERDE